MEFIFPQENYIYFSFEYPEACILLLFQKNEQLASTERSDWINKCNLQADDLLKKYNIHSSLREFTDIYKKKKGSFYCVEFTIESRNEFFCFPFDELILDANKMGATVRMSCLFDLA